MLSVLFSYTVKDLNDILTTKLLIYLHSHSILSQCGTYLLSFSVPPPLQCPVTCGGGVRSRTVTCALTPVKSCDPTTKPRSRSLCALQSCPNLGLRRRPGPPPKYRRILPPKSQPTKLPANTTRVSSTTTAAPTTAAVTVRKKTTTKETTTAFVPTTTSLSTTEITIPEIIDTDSYEFDEKVRKNEERKKTKSAEKDRKSTEVGQGKEEEIEEGEEGSTPNVVVFTPGYDYVVEERTTEEEGIIDLDVTTAKSLRKTFKSTTPKPHLLITPTVQTSPPTTHTTKAATTTTRPSSTPRTTTETWTKTTHHTTPRVNPFSFRTPRKPLITPMDKDSGITPTLSTTTRKPFSTTAPPQPTVKIIKLKKPAVTPKKTSSTTRSKKPSSLPKGGRSKGQNERQQSPKLSAGETVSRDVFWAVGNWSEVRLPHFYLL